MKEYIINIDSIAYRNKCDVKMGSVDWRLIHNIESLSVKELADKVGNNGKAFLRAFITEKRTAEHFQQQDFLVLDFDDGFPYEKFKDRCQKYDLLPAFTYKTLSSSRELLKFRAVFVLERTVTNPVFASALNYLMYNVFPESDSSCTDLSRIFLGGKKLMDFNQDAIVRIEDVVNAAQDHMNITKAGNYSRDLRRLAKKIKVQIYNGNIGILKKEEIPDGIESEIIVQGDYVLICYDKKNEIQNSSGRTNKATTGEELKIVTGYEEDELLTCCELLSDYSKDVEDNFPHDLKFLLATSLCHISGGETLFFKYLRRHERKWRNDWKRNIKKLFPQKCEGKCPHWEKCKATSLYQKLSGKIIKLQGCDSYFPLKACEEELKECLYDAVDQNDESLYVIKGQTALGKTEIYCRMIQERTDKKFVIAVPTCKLQEEVARRLEEKGVRCYMTKSIYKELEHLGLPDLFDLVKEDYENGFGRHARKRIRAYYVKNKNCLNPYQLEKLKKILGKSQGISKERCIVTTHAYFLLMNLSEVADYEIIIDEDILMTLFKKNKEVPIEDIEYAVRHNIFCKHNTKLLKDILKMENEKARKVDFISLTDQEMDILYQEKYPFKGAIPLLLESECVSMDKVRNTVLFFKKTELQRRKMIVVSASANKELYNDYFSGWNINFWNIHKAKYKGEVIQYASYSMSRACIRKYGKKIIEENIKKITGEVDTISFKMFDDNSQIHFGKTEGFDEYKGKDIAVVGTPHILSSFYKLIGEAMGYSQDGEVLCKRRIERNGYSFVIMTFGNSDMQNLQLFFIESELEQAIGRARVLRCDCKVYVFSNFPCEQAEIKEDKFLPELEEEDEIVEK